MPNRNWDTTSLEALAHIEMGQSPPSEFVSGSEGSGVPFLQGNAEFSVVNPLPRLWCRKPSKMCKVGDALISVRAPVGAINRADRDYCIGRGLAAIRFTGVDPDFGYHALGYFSTALRRVAQGTTFEAVGRAELRALSFRRCSPAEQRHIATILDTLDDVIRRTEQVIAKLKQAKQGLIHDLLTRGVDEHGGLRPLESEAPDRYKNSPVGSISKDWRHATLQEVSEKIVDRDHITPTYTSDGVLMVSPTHFVEDEGIDFGCCPSIPMRDHLQNSKKTDVRTDDILIHRIGAGLGGVRLVQPEWPEFSILHSLAMIRPSLQMIFPGFLLWALRTDTVRRQMELGTQSIGVPDLGLEKIGALLLPLPGLPEQSRIVAVLSGLQGQVESERQSLQKLRNLRVGLQHDLLTGRVRVPTAKEDA